MVSFRPPLIDTSWTLGRRARQIQNGDLHHTLVEIGSAVFDDLHGHNLLRLEILALDYLAKCTLAEDVKNQVPVPAGVSILPEGKSTTVVK